MGKARCGHGHLYDTDIYPTCPYCNNSDAWINLTPDKPDTWQKQRKEMRVTDENGTKPVSLASAGIPASGNDVKVTDPNATEMTDEIKKSMERRAAAENKTKSIYAQEKNYDPVVGWLVCIEGAEIGKDYKLYGRINLIGRGSSMDVCIKGDDTISEKNHARVSYDYRNNKFKLVPADSLNVIYINDETLDVPVVLKPYDIIDFGKTKLMFVPFCCEKFKWNDEKKDEA